MAWLSAAGRYACAKPLLLSQYAALCLYGALAIEIQLWQAPIISTVRTSVRSCAKPDRIYTSDNRVRVPGGDGVGVRYDEESAPKDEQNMTFCVLDDQGTDAIFVAILNAKIRTFEFNQKTI